MEVNSQSLPSSTFAEPPWGFLSSIRSSSVIRLVNDRFLVGRDNRDADYQFEKETLGLEYQNTNKQHFAISRTPLKSGQWLVSIEDLSSKGTFVDGKLIGRGKTCLLGEKSRISIVHPQLEVFDFYDVQPRITVPGITAEITAEYLVAEHLGSGGFGNVYLIIKKSSKKKFAMKSIHLRGGSGASALKEVSIMHEIRNPFIVEITSATISTRSCLYIFMEYISGGDLENYLRARQQNLREEQVKFIIYQLITAVAYLHRKRIVHRDIKPSNILCSSKKAEFPQIKLTDFGLSKIMDHSVQTVRTRAGTRGYRAPEMLVGDVFDTKCDVWSVGIVFFYCVCRELPLDELYLDRWSDWSDEDPEIFLDTSPVRQQIRYKTFLFEPEEIWSSIDETTKGLISCMLAYDAYKRPKSNKILHSWYFTKDVNMNRRFQRLQNINQSEKFADESTDRSTDGSVKEYTDGPANKSTDRSIKESHTKFAIHFTEQLAAERWADQYEESFADVIAEQARAEAANEYKESFADIIADQARAEAAYDYLYEDPLDEWLAAECWADRFTAY